MLETILGFILETGKDILMLLGACDVVIYFMYKHIKNNEE